MTTAEALLEGLRSRGIELETDGQRLRWRPGFLVSKTAAGKLLSHRAEVIALLQNTASVATCPCCHWPLDAARRCPKCFDRLCAGCGGLTGSYLIRLCTACGHSAGRGVPRES